jgi:hypothetical protein
MPVGWLAKNAHLASALELHLLPEPESSQCRLEAELHNTLRESAEQAIAAALEAAAAAVASGNAAAGTAASSSSAGGWSISSCKLATGSFGCMGILQAFPASSLTSLDVDLCVDDAAAQETLLWLDRLAVVLTSQKRLQELYLRDSRFCNYDVGFESALRGAASLTQLTRLQLPQVCDETGNRGKGFRHQRQWQWQQQCNCGA